MCQYLHIFHWYDSSNVLDSDPVIDPILDDRAEFIALLCRKSEINSIPTFLINVHRFTPSLFCPSSTSDFCDTFLLIVADTAASQIGIVGVGINLHGIRKIMGRIYSGLPNDFRAQ